MFIPVMNAHTKRWGKQPAVIVRCEMEIVVHTLVVNMKNDESSYMINAKIELELCTPGQ